MAIPNDPMNRPATSQVPRSPGGYSPQAVRDAQFQLGQNAPYLGMNPPTAQQPMLFQPQQQYQMPQPAIQPTQGGEIPQQQQQQTGGPFASPVMQPPMGMPTGLMPGGRLPVGPGFEQGSANWYEDPFNYANTPFKQGYVDAIGPLKRTMEEVATNKSFTPEQKQQAFEKIRSAMDDVNAAYQQGLGIIPQFEPSYGTPRPEPVKEIFGAAPAGLVPTSSGFRNPQTGDIIPSVPTNTGEMLPRPTSQAQTDFLPAGTRYVDFDGKIKTAEGRDEAAKSTSTESARSGAAHKELTREGLVKEFTTWGKNNPLGSSAEERSLLESLPLTPEQKARIVSDPEGLIAGLPPEQRQQINSARLRAFQRSYSESQQQGDELSRMFGIQEEAKPKQPLDERYIIEAGSMGTVRAMRRGSRLTGGIPVVQGRDGQMRAAPSNLAELADLERDTEFVNIRPDASGKVDSEGRPFEIRVTPFSKETIDTQDFVMSDSIRTMMMNSGQILARPKAEWDAFEKKLSEFATVGEQWNPEANPRQAELVKFVSDYYRELSPAGKYGMTLYIAQGLGYNVTGRGGKSMGFGGLENPQMQKSAEQARQNAKYRFQPEVLANAFKAQAESLGNAPGELGSIARGVAGLLSRPLGTSGSFRAAERGVTTKQRMQKAYDEQLQIIGANIAGHARLQAPGDYALGKRGNSQVEKALAEEVIKQIPDDAMKEQLRKGLASYFGWDAEATRNVPAQAQAAAMPQAQAPAKAPEQAAPAAQSKQPAPSPVTTDSQSFVSSGPTAMDMLRQLNALTGRPSKPAAPKKPRKEPKFGEVPSEVREYDQMLAEGGQIISESVAKNKAAEEEKKAAELKKMFGDYDPNKPRWQPEPAKLRDMGTEPTSGSVEDALAAKRPEKRFAPGKRDETKETAGVPFEEALRKKSQPASDQPPAKEEKKFNDTVSMLPDMKNEERKLREKLRKTVESIGTITPEETRRNGPKRKYKLEAEADKLEERIAELRSRMKKLGAP